MTPTPTPPAEVDVAEGRRLLEAQRAATTARWRCERGEADGHLGDLLQAETRAIELLEMWLDANLPALLDKIDTAAEQVAGLRETILSAANICEHWADESRNGGWSTHQVEPNRRLAASLRKAALGAAP